VKDLLLLLENRSIKYIIIVDNKVLSFALHFTNGIPVINYEGNKNDKELVVLTAYLQSFLKVKDVREKIKENFKLEKFVKRKIA